MHYIKLFDTLPLLHLTMLMHSLDLGVLNSLPCTTEWNPSTHRREQDHCCRLGNWSSYCSMYLPRNPLNKNSSQQDPWSHQRCKYYFKESIPYFGEVLLPHRIQSENNARLIVSCNQLQLSEAFVEAPPWKIWFHSFSNPLHSPRVCCSPLLVVWEWMVQHWVLLIVSWSSNTDGMWVQLRSVDRVLHIVRNQWCLN